MWFDVDQRSSIPIYQQLVEGVKGAVAKGLLAAGDRLPSVRELAAQIIINPNTITKAYQELEREGVIETLRGRGTFVAARTDGVNRSEKEKRIKGMLEKILVEAYYLQLTEEDCLTLLQEAARDWYRQRKGT